MGLLDFLKTDTRGKFNILGLDQISLEGDIFKIGDQVFNLGKQTIQKKFATLTFFEIQRITLNDNSGKEETAFSIEDPAGAIEIMAVRYEDLPASFLFDCDGDYHQAIFALEAMPIIETFVNRAKTRGADVRRSNYHNKFFTAGWQAQSMIQPRVL